MRANTKIEPSFVNQSKPFQDPVAELVDEFTELHAQVKAFEATQIRYDELKKQLAACADQQGDGEVRLTGRQGYVLFSKPSTTRAINDLAKFLSVVGLDGFMKCVKVSVVEADKLLDAKEKAELFTTSQGSRRLKDCAKLIDVLGAGLTAARH